MRLAPAALAAAAIIAAALSLSAVAQELPEITAEDAAAAMDAVESANLSDAAYRNLWCGGSFALAATLAKEAQQTVVAAQSAVTRDKLYFKAAVELLAAGVTEGSFTAIAENVYRVALAQVRNKAETPPDFTEADCTAAAQ